MISGLCKRGLFDEVLSLLSKMEDNGGILDVVTYEILIQALFGKGMIDITEKLICEMVARGLL
jgi:pentatricopeptide repeat protein